MTQLYYKGHNNFSAHGKSVESLLKLYGVLECNPDLEIPMTPFVVFMAFAVESYMNSIGHEKVPYWVEIERLPWRNKMNILHQAAGKQAEWGRNPLQFANSVFVLRDKLAHGKPETVCKTALASNYSSNEEFVESLVPQWFSGINKEWVLAAKLKFTSLMVHLGSLHGFDHSHHLMISSGEFSTIAGEDGP
jgi:hypothetical protein